MKRVRKTCCWVAWEASQDLGGIGVAIECICNTRSYRQYIGRTILAGPMSLPPNMNSESKCIDEIAYTLKSDIAYYNGECRSEEIPTDLAMKLREIERRHGVSLAYLRSEIHEHPIERILVDLSSTLTTNAVYSNTLRNFISELNYRFDLDIEYKSINSHEPTRRGFRQSYENYQHSDNDFIHGLLVAQPIVESLDAILEGEQCILHALNYFSLPTAYASLLCDNVINIKPFYLAGEVKPVRDWVEGNITRDIWEEDKIHTHYYEHLTQIAMCHKIYPSARQRGGIYSEETILPSSVKRCSSYKLIYGATKLPHISAISKAVAYELSLVNKDFEGRVSLSPHGNRYINCRLGDKYKSKSRVIELLEDSDAQFRIDRQGLALDRIYLSTHICRTEKCKRLDRDIGVIRHLSGQLAKDFLFIHVFVGDFSNEYGAYIRELAKINSRIKKNGCGAYFKIIENPRWPEKSVAGISRDDFYRAVDINFGLSSYEAYGISALESLSSGAISVISSNAGAAQHIKEFGNKQQTNVLSIPFGLVNFVSGNKPALKVLKNKTHINEPADTLEELGVREAAMALFRNLPRNVEDRRKLLMVGRSFSNQMSWERMTKKYLIPKYAQIFGNNKRHGQTYD